MKIYQNKQGAIATLVDTPSGKYYEVKSREFSGKIPAVFIENSCDWTEIKEIVDNRDYIVTQYVTDFGNVYTKNGPMYSNADKNSYYTEEELAFKFKKLEIKSIERKSDGAEYTIGGQASPCYSTTLHGPITRFVPVGNTIQIWGNFLGMHSMGFLAQINPYTIKGYEILEMVNPEGVVYTFRNGDCIGLSSHENAGRQAVIIAVSSTDFSKLEITKIKRTSDGQVIAVNDDFEYYCGFDYNPNLDFKGKLLKIEFEVAPADKGTGRLSFIHEDKYWGKWLRLGGFKILPKFVTKDGVTINKGDEYHVVFQLMDKLLIKAKTYNGKRPKTFVSFSTRALAERYVLDNTKGLSITDFIEVSGSIPVDYYNQLVKRLRPDFDSFNDLPF